MLPFVLALKLLSSPVDPAQLKCEPVAEADGRELLPRGDGWSDDEHPALALCGRIALPGKAWAVFVRETLSGQVWDRDFIYLVPPKGSPVAVHGRQDEEGRAGREERSAVVSSSGVELTVRRFNPVLEDVVEGGYSIAELRRERWAFDAGRLVLTSTVYPELDGAWRDRESGAWLFISGARRFFLAKGAERASELQAPNPREVLLPDGRRVKLEVLARGTALRAGALQLERAWYP